MRRLEFITNVLKTLMTKLNRKVLKTPNLKVTINPELSYVIFILKSVLPSAESSRNSCVNGHGDAVNCRRKNVSRIGHVDLLDKVVVIHDLAELADHNVG